MMTLDQLAQAFPGALRVGEGNPLITRVHTDTRSLQAGDLFVALKGERFDAHDFLAQARASGAVAALAQRDLASSGLPGLEVPDTLAGLGQMATWWRSRHSLPLVAVTGSNGKTTVTQMLASILRAWMGEQALATQGNLNNEIGVPLTLLRLTAEHRCAVVELGMNHPGEIARLAAMAQPTVALVNNAQREHLEFMATVDAVAQENGTVLAALSADGVAVFPAHDTYSHHWVTLAQGRRCLRFGWHPVDARFPGVEADVWAASHQWRQGAWWVDAQTPVGPLSWRLRIAGRHNVLNALAAASCALAAGVPASSIVAGLESFEAVKGRSRALTLTVAGRRITVVDDTYNANPDSMRAAVDVLADLPGPRLLILGDMGEVGDQGPQFHAEVGQHARRSGIDVLWALGDQSAQAARHFGGGRHFKSFDALLAALPDQLTGAASVLVKGSRFMRMERVVDALLQLATPHSTVKENNPCS